MQVDCLNESYKCSKEKKKERELKTGQGTVSSGIHRTGMNRSYI